MIRPIQRVLVANRGEIARRVMRTCRDLGIGTVAVFSDADAEMPFVGEADFAVRIGPAPSAESYLSIEAILEAARTTGADAIHPGYGFLAENAAFADACAEAGLVFIGPGPDAIRAMGSKKEAKALVAAAGVPVVPGYDGAEQDPAILAAEAVKVGFPVLLKASAGGGGKGMKRVHRAEELAEAIASARREAESGFGDGTLLIERYVEAPRHVEIQILGDAHGALIHLNERECSIQRRHQKIIEETPSPALDSELRRRMGEAAVKCGQAIGYRNAGTVEFLLAPDGEFYFLEVNTRLQVEHPITEAVTGVDLVAEQIRVAEGRPLAMRQEEVKLEGAAIEVRIYAEDPAKDFLPQTGRIVDWDLPPMVGFREDSGVTSGDEVGIHYDPMLAKLITWGADRDEALRRMRSVLAGAGISGLVTNRDFLLRILEHEAFSRGEYDTHFIESRLDELLGAGPSEEARRGALIAAALMRHEERRAARLLLPELPSGFRNNPTGHQWVEFALGDVAERVEYSHRGDGVFDFVVGEDELEVRGLRSSEGEISFEEGGVRRRFRVVSADARLFVRSPEGAFELRELPRFPEREAEVVPGGCVAPMPGKVVQLRVEVGASVSAGEVILILEAMKMENAVTAPNDGVVAELRVAEGDQVEADALLAVVTEPSD